MTTLLSDVVWDDELPHAVTGPQPVAAGLFLLLAVLAAGLVLARRVRRPT